MEVLTRRGMALPTLLLVLTCALVFIVPEVTATRYIVGGKFGWSPNNVNFTDWAKEHKFILDDWLFFVYDRNQQNVLEVNKTNYDNCIADHPVHNWTTGAGRDVVPLNVTRHYYFISGNGFCYGGMKLAVLVTKPPPPPKAAPVKNGSPLESGSQIFTRAALAIGVVWTIFSHVW
ncbi:lamin-like protein [Thalictrum thalictroides]|uniref:Lamin-like protein n=1 Tax=Thalictrum thalictroides TaxID=46969 RepID=A0A7J6UTL9_THATH|nr:lamin-like protein [Thalictrum thalictroides]